MDLNTKNAKFQSQVRLQLSVSLCAGEATSFIVQFDHHKKTTGVSNTLLSS